MIRERLEIPSSFSAEIGQNRFCLQIISAKSFILLVSAAVGDRPIRFMVWYGRDLWWGSEPSESASGNHLPCIIRDAEMPLTDRQYSVRFVRSIFCETVGNDRRPINPSSNRRAAESVPPLERQVSDAIHHPNSILRHAGDFPGTGTLQPERRLGLPGEYGRRDSAGAGQPLGLLRACAACRPDWARSEFSHLNAISLPAMGCIETRHFPHQEKKPVKNSKETSSNNCRETRQQRKTGVRRSVEAGIRLMNQSLRED